MGNILITGVNGFVGNYLSGLMLSSGFNVRGAVRAPAASNSQLPCTVVGDINSQTDWRIALVECDVVIHLAARVHIMSDSASDPLLAFRQVNVEGAANLARQASKAGVKRFIYLSSIKVNGEGTHGIPFLFSDNPSPQDPYGISKCEAEKVLRQISVETGLELVVIRPPLIYGPGVKGNLHALSTAVNKGIPLPLGSVHNRRDLVSIYNLCDLVLKCLVSSAAAGHTFLVSDDCAISTTQLVRYMAEGLKKKPFLLPIPVGLMKFGAGLLGRSAVADRLFGDLEIDISHTKDVLGWIPPYSVKEAFNKMYQEVCS